MSYHFPSDLVSPSPLPYDVFDPEKNSSMQPSLGLFVGIGFDVIVLSLATCLICFPNANSTEKKTEELEDDDSQFNPLDMVQFLDEMEKDKPIRFTSQQLRIAIDDFSIFLGSGGFRTVYKGLISNNKSVAVKVLNGASNKRVEQQFMAEVSTMGRTHHYNLVRLYGFFFESTLIALVYEFMVNGSLDNHLFKGNKEPMLGFDKLHEIAVGTARGIAYLHEECAQRIVHYDIKPGNILLDSNFCAKVADFGLAKLCNRDKTHITIQPDEVPQATLNLSSGYLIRLHINVMFIVLGCYFLRSSGEGGIWMCLSMIANNGSRFGHRVNTKKKQLKDLMIVCGIEEKDQEVVERMLKVALCCVQYRPGARPVMSIIVKMLEGVLEVPEPLNPFTHLFSGANEPNDSLAKMAWNVGISDWSSSEVVTRSDAVKGTPLMRRYEITIASK